jgi:hypothetical protein
MGNDVLINIKNPKPAAEAEVTISTMPNCSILRKHPVKMLILASVVPSLILNMNFTAMETTSTKMPCNIANNIGYLIYVSSGNAAYADILLYDQPKNTFKATNAKSTITRVRNIEPSFFITHTSTSMINPEMHIQLGN